MDSFSYSLLSSAFYIGTTWKKLPENLEFGEMLHGDITDIHAAVRFLSFPRAGLGMQDRIISHG